MAAAGSSPRVRGTQDGRRVAGAVDRFIPAGAGNTARWAPGRRRGSVHPRGCGEHALSFSGDTTAHGSSPRVRGTLVEVAGFGGGGRFIPAGAGNTPRSMAFQRVATVHPRGCGEHCLLVASGPPGSGSSPRVRGTRARGRTGICRERFIPAGAGNTASRQGRPMCATVHPRGCGEHVSGQGRERGFDGSSPRVRGTPPASRGYSSVSRFIPAGAGNTCLDSGVAFQCSGSSPRVRGTLNSQETAMSESRFIPAGAGNTGAGMRRLGPASGSSPRVRGTLFLAEGGGWGGRFIPAGAGNTPARKPTRN